MRLTTGVLASALGCCTQLASAATGHVYTFDPSASAQDVVRSQLDPATARLVLAHRAGVEDYHVETALREDEIEQINILGSKESLFGGKGRRQRMFLLAPESGDGSESIMSLLASKASAIISIDAAPTAATTKDLLRDLENQYRHDIESSPSFDASREEHDVYAIFHDLASLEWSFLQAVGEGLEVTALVMPAHEDARTGSDSYQWGTYRMPQSTFHKKREQPQREKLLSDAEPAHSTLESGSAPMTDYASNNTSPLRGILPACYRSQDECEKTTRSCSGHGKCFKKYHDQDAASGAKGDCYACACSATKEKVGSDGGVKTTHWGGPACQKKDVSMSFWLIALFTVGLVFVVSFAVGQIYSMGSEELPSVIGAGVSGPVRK